MATSAVNDNATYQKLSADIYARRLSDAMANPKRVIADREAQATGEQSASANPAVPANAAPASMSQAQFSGYSSMATPAAKAAQQAALAKMLAARAAQEKASAASSGDE